MIEFITVLAWIFGILSTIMTISRMIGFFSYSEIQKLVDAMDGVERTFPVIKCGSLAIFSWAWIITQW